MERRYILPIEEKSVYSEKIRGDEVERFPSKCTGCKLCMVACSIYNFGKNNPELSMIRIKDTTLEWLMGEVDMDDNHPYKRIICRQCPDPSPCMDACPMDAFERNEKTGAIVVKKEDCVTCRSCIDACPHEACWYSESLDRILKCNLCDGNEPACVNACPSGLILFNIESGGHNIG